MTSRPLAIDTACRSILHVDGDPQTLRTVADHLKSRGFNVISLANPKHLIDQLIVNDCRVVLLDIEIPGANGLDMLREIKRTDGGLQVIVLSGVVPLTTMLESMCFGAENYVFKPLENFDALDQALDDVFQKIDRWKLAVEDLARRRRARTVVNATRPSKAHM